MDETREANEISKVNQEGEVHAVQARTGRGKSNLSYRRNVTIGYFSSDQEK
jgi:hypothetical protein